MQRSGCMYAIEYRIVFSILMTTAACFVMFLASSSQNNPSRINAITATNTRTLNYQASQLIPGKLHGQTLQKVSHIGPGVPHIGPKVSHIGFLKVHKAGSTTIQNLFFRFGLQHNLSFALPKQGNYLKHQRNALFGKYNQHFDVLAIHTMFDPEMVNSLLPPDSVKIAIVRDPLARMVSAAFYYRDVFGVENLKSIPTTNFIHHLVTQPDRYDRGTFSVTRNAMGRDFGFASTMKSTDTRHINNYIDYLRKQFSLVLIVERFDESLVLMKRLLRWSLRDVLYLKINSNDHAPINLNQSETRIFQKTCFLDVALYNAFSHDFEVKVNQEQNDFEKEVSDFKTIIMNVSTFCAENTTDPFSALFIHKSRWNDNFKVTQEDCQLMTTDELKFIEYLRQRQRKLFP